MPIELFNFSRSRLNKKSKSSKKYESITLDQINSPTDSFNVSYSKSENQNHLIDKSSTNEDSSHDGGFDNDDYITSVTMAEEIQTESISTTDDSTVMVEQVEKYIQEGNNGVRFDNVSESGKESIKFTSYTTNIVAKNESNMSNIKNSESTFESSLVGSTKSVSTENDTHLKISELENDESINSNTLITPASDKTKSVKDSTQFSKSNKLSVRNNDLTSKNSLKLDNCVNSKKDDHLQISVSENDKGSIESNMVITSISDTINSVKDLSYSSKSRKVNEEKNDIGIKSSPTSSDLVDEEICMKMNKIIQTDAQNEKISNQNVNDFEITMYDVMEETNIDILNLLNDLYRHESLDPVIDDIYENCLVNTSPNKIRKCTRSKKKRPQIKKYYFVKDQEEKKIVKDCKNHNVPNNIPNYDYVNFPNNNYPNRSSSFQIPSGTNITIPIYAGSASNVPNCSVPPYKVACPIHNSQNSCHSTLRIPSLNCRLHGVAPSCHNSFQHRSTCMNNGNVNCKNHRPGCKNIFSDSLNMKSNLNSLTDEFNNISKYYPKLIRKTQNRKGSPFNWKEIEAYL